jgi:hypothetical protein
MGGPAAASCMLREILAHGLCPTPEEDYDPDTPRWEPGPLLYPL